MVGSQIYLGIGAKNKGPGITINQRQKSKDESGWRGDSFELFGELSLNEVDELRGWISDQI